MIWMSIIIIISIKQFHNIFSSSGPLLNQVESSWRLNIDCFWYSRLTLTVFPSLLTNKHILQHPLFIVFVLVLHFGNFLFFNATIETDNPTERILKAKDEWKSMHAESYGFCRYRFIDAVYDETI